MIDIAIKKTGPLLGGGGGGGAWKIDMTDPLGARLRFKSHI